MFIFCFTLVWFLSLNDRAFQEYLSENAMLVGSSSPRTSIGSITALINNAYSSNFSDSGELAHFYPESSNQFACSVVSCPRCSLPLSVCVATSRSDGKDALLLAARTPSPKCSTADNRASALEALITTLVSHRAAADGWLGRDLYLVLVPCECSLADSLENWLHLHHESAFDSHLPFITNAPALWAGMIISIQHPSLELVNIQNIGNRGRLTNLDVVYAATWTIRNQGLAVDIERNMHTQKKLSSISVPSSSLKLSSFIMSQALGASSGAHGLLLDRQIEAITLQAQALSGANSTDQDWIRQPNAIRFHKFASSVELLLRTQSNVLERYHQSYFYYAISALVCSGDGGGCYIPISHYLLVVGLLLLPLVLATFDFTLRIENCDWMLCWMLHGASALFSLSLFHWFSRAIVKLSLDYPSVYILAFCCLSSLLVASIVSGFVVELSKRRVPLADMKVIGLGLDAVALVNALAVITHISISNGAQGLVAAMLVSPLVCTSFYRLLIHVRCILAFLLNPLLPSAMYHRIISASIISLACCSCRWCSVVLGDTLCRFFILIRVTTVSVRTVSFSLDCPIFNIFFWLVAFIAIRIITNKADSGVVFQNKLIYCHQKDTQHKSAALQCSNKIAFIQQTKRTGSKFFHHAPRVNFSGAGVIIHGRAIMECAP
jgi:hypothetical protein